MDLDAALRAGGHRVTAPRRIVWDVLTRADGHLSAAEVAERARARDEHVDVSSVYRTLALFADLGMVRESRLGDEATWEPTHDDSVVHLVCDGCGAVIHHDASTVRVLRRQLDDEVAFDVDAIDIRVTGRCPSCSA